MRIKIYNLSWELNPEDELEDWDEESVSDYIDKLKDEEFETIKNIISNWFNEPFDGMDDDNIVLANQ